MSFFSADNLRALTSGRWLRRPAGSQEPTAICIDSRADVASAVFVAIRGANHDGHDFVGDVARAGAAIAIVQRTVDLRTLPEGIGVMRVEDTRRALAQIALGYRRRLAGTRVIAITGSCGKTTTKRMIHHVLSSRLAGSAAPRSFNNDIGVPLTILAAKPGDQFLVIEIGTSNPGEIARLAAIAEPDVAVITKLGQAHLERFASVDAIAEEKASLLPHLRRGGIAIVNADAPQLRRYVRRLETSLLFGTAADADLRLTARGRDGDRWFLETNHRVRYPLSLPGEHNAINALAAIAIGRRFGLSDDQIGCALATVDPEPMRLVCRHLGDLRVYDDAYNASPESMLAALDTFAELESDAARRIVILGDMLELGEAGPELHRVIGERILQLESNAAIDHVVAIGPLAENYVQPLRSTWPGDRLTCVPSLDDRILRSIGEMLKPGDAVLVKASRGIGLDRIVHHLEQTGSAEQTVEHGSMSRQTGDRDRAAVSPI